MTEEIGAASGRSYMLFTNFSPPVVPAGAHQWYNPYVHTIAIFVFHPLVYTSLLHYLQMKKSSPLDKVGTKEDASPAKIVTNL